MLIGVVVNRNQSRGIVLVSVIQTSLELHYGHAFSWRLNYSIQHPNVPKTHLISITFNASISATPHKPSSQPKLMKIITLQVSVLLLMKATHTTSHSRRRHCKNLSYSTTGRCTCEASIPKALSSYMWDGVTHASKRQHKYGQYLETSATESHAQLKHSNPL